VVDFACVPLKLVIEIDVGLHGLDEMIPRDHLRQTEIEALGCTVIRNAKPCPNPRRSTRRSSPTRNR
jgi:very-short-patch-repair endonuclease